MEIIKRFEKSNTEWHLTEQNANDELNSEPTENKQVQAMPQPNKKQQNLHHQWDT